MQLLANGKQQFIDGSGAPLASGKVYFYAPATLTPATTYQDAAGTIPNTNPVNLDSLGQAVIWGNGTYRQVVKDSAGNQVWDQIAAAPDLNAPLAGLSGASGSAMVGYGLTNLAAMVKANIAQVVGSITALRAIDKTKYTQATVTGYYAPGDGGGGVYYYDAADAASADNGGTVIVAADGGRWKLAWSNVLTVKLFGAKGDGTTDDTAACQSAISAMKVRGGILRFPAGRYLITGTGLLIDRTALSADSDLTRFVISGDGDGTTELNYTGSGTLLSYEGSITGSGANSNFAVIGIRLFGNNTATQNGLRVRKAALFTMRDVSIKQCNYGLLAYDVLSSAFYDSKVTFCNYGVTLQKDVFSNPNAISFFQCAIGGNYKYGAAISNPTTVNFYGGSVENNGTDGTAGNRAIGISNRTGSDEGAVAATFDGVYFEGNGGDCDIFYDTGSVNANGLLLKGCSFNRVSGMANKFVVNNVKMNVVTPAKSSLTVIGCGFNGFNDYTASSARRYIAITGAAGALWNFTDQGNVYSNDIERPLVAGPVKSGLAMATAFVQFNGTNAAVGSSFNIFSVTRNSTGDYTITFEKPFNFGTYVPSFAMGGGVGIVSMFSNLPGSIRIQTFNLSAVQTDYPYLAMTIFGGGDPI